MRTRITALVGATAIGMLTLAGFGASAQAYEYRQEPPRIMNYFQGHDHFRRDFFWLFIHRDHDRRDRDHDRR